MDATRPEPERPSPEHEHEHEHEHESGLRCPYCKGALAAGALAGACVACGTLHHIACFAEHGGCSIHACGSTRARPNKVGAPVAPADFVGLPCGACRKVIPSHAMVARCDRCFGILHVDCYEPLGSCLLAANGACRGRIELMPHVEAVAAQTRRQGNLLMLSGAALLVTFATLAALAMLDGEARLMKLFGIFASGGLLLGVIGAIVGRLAPKTSASAVRPARTVTPKDSGPPTSP